MRISRKKFRTFFEIFVSRPRVTRLDGKPALPGKVNLSAGVAFWHINFPGWGNPRRRLYGIRVAQFVLKIEKLPHIMSVQIPGLTVSVPDYSCPDANQDGETISYVFYTRIDYKSTHKPHKPKRNLAQFHLVMATSYCQTSTNGPLHNGYFSWSRPTVHTLILTSLQRPPLHNGKGEWPLKYTPNYQITYTNEWPVISSD